MSSVSEPDFLRLTRAGYDRTAVGYAQRFHRHLDGKPVDQAILASFAGLIRVGKYQRVADVGCGTGATTKILSDHGVETVGVDLSPAMISEARRLNPELAFEVGSMTGLGIASDSLGGLCAWYSVIHVPDESLPLVLREFHRVLAPGGHVLLAFQVGDAPLMLSEAFGRRVDLTFHRRHPDVVTALLADAGLPVYAQMVRRPDDDGLESTPQAYLIARKSCVEA